MKTELEESRFKTVGCNVCGFTKQIDIVYANNNKWPEHCGELMKLNYSKGANSLNTMIQLTKPQFAILTQALEHNANWSRKILSSSAVLSDGVKEDLEEIERRAEIALKTVEEVRAQITLF